MDSSPALYYSMQTPDISHFLTLTPEELAEAQLKMLAKLTPEQRKVVAVTALAHNDSQTALHLLNHYAAELDSAMSFELQVLVAQSS